MKYSECRGLPPMIPRQHSLFIRALMQGTYIGLMSSPPNRIGTMMTTDRQSLTVDEDDWCEVSSAVDWHSSSRSSTYTAQIHNTDDGFHQHYPRAQVNKHVPVCGKHTTLWQTDLTLKNQETNYHQKSTLLHYMLVHCIHIPLLLHVLVCHKYIYKNIGIKTMDIK